LPLPIDVQVRQLFDASVSITLGDGATSSFWHDAWLFDMPFRTSFPDLFAVCTKRALSVRDALAESRWCRHFKRSISPIAIRQFTEVWEAVQNVQLQEDVRDSLTWKWTDNGVFSVQSAYNIQFEGTIATNYHRTIWDSDAPLKCQFFVWLAVLGRCLTADNLLKRGMPHNPFCPLCFIHHETALHLLLGCSFAHQIWGLVFNRCLLVPRTDMCKALSIDEWWSEQVVGLNKVSTRRFNSIATVVSWELWKERNDRIFNQMSKSPSQVFYKIIETATDWCAAGRILVHDLLNRPREPD
jgi:hypothetical protein